MKELRVDETLWQKTQYANLVRYKPSKKYFARIRISGKLIRRSLKTSVLSVAKLRLGDLEKKERQLAEHQTAAADGRMSFGDALSIYEQRLKGDVSLKASHAGIPAATDKSDASVMAGIETDGAPKHHKIGLPELVAHIQPGAESNCLQSHSRDS